MRNPAPELLQYEPMFDFLWRKKKKEAAPAGKAQPKPVEKTIAFPHPAAAEAPKPTPPKSPSGEAEEPGFKVGQTMRVPGLGEFYVHDIKGGKGKSGMGIVYIAVDAHNMTPFAVKTFQRWCLETPELVQRFLREAETWIRLEQHQNIVRAYYVATLNGQPYVFLEYVAGSDLRKKLAAGPLPVRDALRYAIQFCRGMAHAQQKVPGLVHRDVKPENCMFTPDDVLKVTDFGLVKVLGRPKLSPTKSPVGGESPSRLFETKAGQIDVETLPDMAPERFIDFASGRVLANPIVSITPKTPPQKAPVVEEEWEESHSQFFRTREGEMGVGTLPYMAPEQFTDFANVTVQADIYSFGVMLYEMLTGRRPFRARRPEEWYHQHSQVVPSDPHLRRPEIGLPLSQIVMRCMAKSPPERYPDFAMLERDLSLLFHRTYLEEVAAAGEEELEAWEILNKGAALNNLGRTKEALACFDKALEILPRFDAGWLNKGVVLWKLGREKEALACYDKAIEINPNSAQSWYNRGLAYQNYDALEDALASYERALTLNPLHDAAWLNKGVILRKLLRSREAVECYDKVLALNPQSAVAWYNKGYALRQMGRVQDELACYEKVLSIDPYYTEAWLNRGVAFRKQNRLIEALGCYDKVLEMQPKHPDAWYNKGMVLRKMGQAREA
ncbi:MAG: tetratricopeptide repeat protein, partial [Acidobacteria bacterium]|nr:tetratricopeptide repeat protein [Acidobacteriota bacterium]